MFCVFVIFDWYALRIHRLLFWLIVHECVALKDAEVSLPLFLTA